VDLNYSKIPRFFVSPSIHTYYGFIHFSNTLPCLCILKENLYQHGVRSEQNYSTINSQKYYLKMINRISFWINVCLTPLFNSSAAKNLSLHTPASFFLDIFRNLTSSDTAMAAVSLKQGRAGSLGRLPRDEENGPHPGNCCAQAVRGGDGQGVWI